MSYCKNCGQEMAEGAPNCTACGCPVGMGIAHCGNCGERIVPGTAFCVKCGTPTGAPAAAPVPPAAPPRKPRSRYAAAAFGIVMGAFGIHNFYLGHVGRGIGQIAVTLGVFALIAGNVLPELSGFLLSGLWGFIEGVLIAVGDVKTDAHGVELRQWNK